MLTRSTKTGFCFEEKERERCTKLNMYEIDLQKLEKKKRKVMVCNVYACFEKEQKNDTRFAVVYPNSKKKKSLKAKEKKRNQAVINAKIVKSKSDLKNLSECILRYILQVSILIMQAKQRNLKKLTKRISKSSLGQ